MAKGLLPSRPTQGRADRVTRKWWFILIVVGVNFLPPIVTRNHAEAYASMNDLPRRILSGALLYSLSSRWWCVFDLAPIALIAGLVLLGNRMRRVFAGYAAVSFVLFAVLQSVAVTKEYGVAIFTCNLIWFLAVAGFWAWEAAAGLNDFSCWRAAWWKWWVVPLAIFAFWVPFAPSAQTGALAFRPLLFLRTHTGLAFCLMTPVYLAILTLHHPRVNLALMRVTALVGIIIAFWNHMTAFVFTSNWYHGVVYVPLTAISIYVLVLSFRKGDSNAGVGSRNDATSPAPADTASAYSD